MKPPTPQTVAEAAITIESHLDGAHERSLADDVLAWELGPDGGWYKVPTVRGLNSHNRSKDLSLESAHGNGLNGVPHV